MTTYLDPKTGATIGYQATKGTTAEPFQVPMAWQTSTLSYVSFLADASGNLLVSGAGGRNCTASTDPYSKTHGQAVARSMCRSTGKDQRIHRAGNVNRNYK